MREWGLQTTEETPKSPPKHFLPNQNQSTKRDSLLFASNLLIHPLSPSPFLPSASTLSLLKDQSLSGKKKKNRKNPMETSPRPGPNPNPNFLTSPKSHSPNSSTTSSSSSSNNNNAPPPTPPSQPPKPITRSESANPFPTTFVQADTSSFKQVVQMLTGSSETAKLASSSKPTAPPQSDPSPKTHIPPIKSIPKNKQNSGFRLYERRSSLKNLKINPLNPVFSPNNSGFSPRKPEILSPSILDFPSLALSPVTPLIPDPFDRSAAGNYANCFNNNTQLDKEAEEKAIKEKGFYLHPSPASTPRDSEPRLLPLFPVTSPRVSGSST